MKRIFIVQNSPIGAPLPLSVYLTGLLNKFKKNNQIQCNLIVSKSDLLPASIKNNFCKIFEIAGSTYSIKDNLVFSLKVFYTLFQENKISTIDIVHCLYPNSSLLGAVLFKILVNHNVKIIYDVRSPWIEMSINRGHVKKVNLKLYRFILYTQEQILCKFVNHFIFISDGLKKYYKNTFKITNDETKITVSPSGVDLTFFKKIKSDIRSKYLIDNETTLIGYVGTIDKTRKMADFLPLFKSLLLKKFKVKLMFVGKGNSVDELKTRSKKLGIEKYIIFVDPVAHSEIPKYISSFDFGLCHLPNIFIYQSCFPLKVLEYLASNVKVLASDISAHREIANDLKNIYLYKDKNSFYNIFSEAINSPFLVNPNLSKYNWEEIKNVYFEIYKKI